MEFRLLFTMRLYTDSRCFETLLWLGLLSRFAARARFFQFIVSAAPPPADLPMRLLPAGFSSNLVD
jgi:hypothetical protein